ncbi:uncharacterized protein LOC124917744 [Impatiens glandulifera]|uniref:uncharacterized protein LOC124917744 n=1 Tax=Impatiens glandulifera TaxID=253017 RepID=UPI001FB1302C|nr:uncharacterized protein LOC124917744 [Impatiens glandulifera]
MGSLQAQENEEKTEVIVYYISKCMTGYKLNYSPVEMVCWDLAWVTKRLRHYMQAHIVKLISRLDPIQYDIVYTVQKSIKGSVVEDCLADQPIEVEDDELAFLDNKVMAINPTTLTLLFDGASGKQGYGIRILLIDPVETYNPISVKLEYPVTNNEAEYETCIYA